MKSEDFSLLSRYLREVPIEQGALLEDRGERVDVVHFPQTGMISLIVEMPEDGSIEVGTIGREGGVGLTVCLGSRIASVSALVQVSGTSLCISASRFRAAAARSRNIQDMSIRYAELQMGQIQQTAACNALHDVPSRLSRWLLQTSDTIEDNTIPFTREFLGKMLGVQRGTISVVAAKFESDGLIHTHRGQIELLDKKRLKKQACFCYEFVGRHIDRLVPKRTVVACDVHVFPLEVKRQQKSWPEKEEREFQWFSPTDAAKVVREPVLRAIIRAFPRRKRIDGNG